jgi:hypothetical protein
MFPRCYARCSLAVSPLLLKNSELPFNHLKHKEKLHKVGIFRLKNKNSAVLPSGTAEFVGRSGPAEWRAIPAIAGAGSGP